MIHGLAEFFVDLVCCRFRLGAYRPIEVSSDLMTPHEKIDSPAFDVRAKLLAAKISKIDCDEVTSFDFDFCWHILKMVFAHQLFKCSFLGGFLERIHFFDFFCKKKKKCITQFFGYHFRFTQEVWCLNYCSRSDIHGDTSHVWDYCCLSACRTDACKLEAPSEKFKSAATNTVFIPDDFFFFNWLSGAAAAISCKGNQPFAYQQDLSFVMVGSL
ncbi:hypothetical protein AB205_0205470 [Aquarana catesbeiana]|uniref:Uncharacterized protein n=1 Tax=Aquarana catesbeiana TaxID=8400 RepID=A0A2G9RS66_AQUCT|nr:hypothetical protein AB205_0205470 [Aquarana catesbeiana]